MSIIFYCNWPNKQEWIYTLKKRFKSEKIQIWPKINNYEKVECAIIWNFPKGKLKKFKNLKIIFSLGAGVDHLFNDPYLPKVPIVRLKDPIMAKRMLNYIHSQILNYQLNIYKYYKNKIQRKWLEEFAVPDNNNLTIGILGSGYIGNYVAKNLYNNGYKVQGFKRTKNNKKTFYKIFDSKKYLKKFLSSSDIIINLLPNTNLTKDFVNKKFLNYMKKKSLFINVGRGTTVNESDLINHLKKNNNFKVVLDVFKEEPLKKSHPFWKQKNIIITPHVAGITNIESSVNQIYDNFRLYKKGKRIKNRINHIEKY